LFTFVAIAPDKLQSWAQARAINMSVTDICYQQQQFIRYHNMARVTARPQRLSVYQCHSSEHIRHILTDSNSTGHFTFWISPSLSPEFGLRPKISQKVEVIFYLDSALAEQSLRRKFGLSSC